jgi:hypothetical protein
MSMKTSNDTIGNQTRDFSTCNPVPQPTVPPRAPTKPATDILLRINFVFKINWSSIVLRASLRKTRQHNCFWFKRFQYLELNYLYSSPNIVQVIKSIRMRWAGHVARMVEGRGVYRVLVGKPEGRRPLGIPRHRWENNIRMDLQEVGCGCVDWMELAQDRDMWRALVSAVMNLLYEVSKYHFHTSLWTI